MNTEWSEEVLAQANQMILEAAEYVLPEYGKIKYFPQVIAYSQALCGKFSPALSIKEVAELETQCGVKFSESFVEFLLLTGDSWYHILETQTGISGAEEMVEDHREFRNRIERNVEYDHKIDDILIISSMYGFDQIWYLKKSEFSLADPPLYAAETSPKIAIPYLPYDESLEADRFSEYINYYCDYFIKKCLKSKEKNP